MIGRLLSGPGPIANMPPAMVRSSGLVVNMAQFSLCLLFDPGSGVCFWANNAATRERYGYAIDHDALPLDARTRALAGQLIARYDTSLNRQDPGGPMNTLTLDVETHGPDESATSYLVPVARIDGALLTDFKRYALDLNELARSLADQGEHLLLTCWCGVPDCMHIDSGFVVKRTADTVQWTPAFPVSAKTLHFEARAYAQAIEALLQSLAGLFLQASAGGARVELVPAGCDRFVGAVDGNA